MKSLNILIVLLIAMLFGCAHLVKGWKADWEYIDDSMGGMTVNAAVAGSKLRLDPTFRIHGIEVINSGHCVRNIEADISEMQILMSVYIHVCNGHDASSDILEISLPREGVYSIVYDDAEAGFPVIGTAVIDKGDDIK